MDFHPLNFVFILLGLIIVISMCLWCFYCYHHGRTMKREGKSNQIKFHLTHSVVLFKIGTYSTQNIECCSSVVLSVLVWYSQIVKPLPTLLTFGALLLALGIPTTCNRLSRASFMSHLIAPPPSTPLK